MTTADTLTNAEIEAQSKAFCDLIVERAAAMMLQSGAPLEMVVDRFLTYALAQTVSTFGRDDAVKMLNGGLGAIADGLFDRMERGAPN